VHIKLFVMWIVGLYCFQESLDDRTGPSVRNPLLPEILFFIVFAKI